MIFHYNEQLEIITSREAQIRTLKRIDPKRVVEVKVNPATAQPIQITAKDMINKAQERLDMDNLWLEELDKMIEEEQPKPIKDTTSGKN